MGQEFKEPSYLQQGPKTIHLKLTIKHMLSDCYIQFIFLDPNLFSSLGYQRVKPYFSRCKVFSWYPATTVLLQGKCLSEMSFQ